MLQRNPLYTAITRAKKLVVLVGSKRAIAMATKNKPGTARTPPWLRDWPLLALNDIDQILFRLVKLFTGWGFAIRRSGSTGSVTVK